jgi:pyruvate/2-oxoglutarate dehydrogenase complex dihydrolipoamide acyltransferase (E2) component
VSTKSILPQWGITSTLAICSILKKPVVRDNEIVIRKMMNAVLLWDHFAMMANTPIEFLNEMKKRLEKPNTYLV